ncbi:serralysin [Cognatiyoonia koreensis]|uniref:Serralysin n=1 Tax=Cognatiyoonia koreensis TaxID=364200 RepID=A0A1I0NHG9_9RHOB|nr:M10 family metallopeptidase C-terminal domain-containing protein [Cognatiyoonia koreensis]SEW00756.1 serralysin [Cognatiyoonia koreensis]
MASVFENEDTTGIDTPYQIAAGDTFTGVISRNYDRDYVAVYLTAGQSHKISVGASNYANMTGTLLDGDGNDLANFLETRGDTQLHYTPEQSGIYYVAVGMDITQTGTYDVSVVEDNDYGLVDIMEIVSQLQTGYWLEANETPSRWNVQVGDVITYDLSDLTNDGKELARWAFAEWEETIGIDFTEVTSGGDITFGDDDYGGYEYHSSQGGYTTEAFINVEAYYSSEYSGIGGYGYYVFLHEIGHALGLGHGGHYNGDADYARDSLWQNDTMMTSIMSYFDADDDVHNQTNAGWAVTPMWADRLALQDYYGTPDINDGDTRYGTNGNNGGAFQIAMDALTGKTDNRNISDEYMLFTIQDTGGIDTFDASGFKNAQEIDLRGGELMTAFDNPNGLFIMPGTVIENAVGSSFDDLIKGNGTRNRLEGSGGDDIIKGLGGNDYLFGGSGNDRIYGGSGNDLIKAVSGKEHFDGGAGDDYISYYNSSKGVRINLSKDEVSGGAGANDSIRNFEGASGSKTGDDVIAGTSGDNIIKTFGGDDRVFGGRGDDRIELGDGDDFVRAGGGEETFYGGSGRDTISYEKAGSGVRLDLYKDTASGGWATNDTIDSFENAEGSKGDDVILGTVGGNVIKGNRGDDKLIGRSGNDTLFGGSGDDFFDGGTGRDVLYGGSGADVFHFDKGEDRDFIKGFENNVDTLQFDGFASGFDAFDFAEQRDNDVIFRFGNGDTVVVEDIRLAQLSNDIEYV